MAFPTLTNPDWLPGSIREELENLVTQITGWLRREHKSSGAHSDIHANSITVEIDEDSGEGGTITAESTISADGNITADADNETHGGVEIGHFQEISSQGVGQGIKLGDGTTGPAWLIIADQNSSPSTRLLTFSDLAGATPAFQVELNGGVYVLEPPSAVSFGLGRSGRRITSIFSAACNVTDGYLERGRTPELGEWTSVAHSDANYAGGGVDSNWVVASGDQITLAYQRVGLSMTVAFTIATSTIANTPTTLTIVIPASLTAAKRMGTVISLVNNGGTREAGIAYVAASGTVINIERISGVAFANGTDNNSFEGTITFETTT